MADTRPVRRPGWVYVLTNPAYNGLVKVGYTARHPAIRAAELSAETGVPARFAVAYAHQVRDCEALEGLAHGRLAAYRTNANREFFRCTVAQARRIIEQEAGAQLLPWWRVILYRLTHPMPRRSPPPGRRPSWRRLGGDTVTAITMAIGLAIGGVVVLRPGWIPPGLLQLVRQLPGLR